MYRKLTLWPWYGVHYQTAHEVGDGIVFVLRRPLVRLFPRWALRELDGVTKWLSMSGDADYVAAG